MFHELVSIQILEGTLFFVYNDSVIMIAERTTHNTKIICDPKRIKDYISYIGMDLETIKTCDCFQNLGDTLVFFAGT